MRNEELKRRLLGYRLTTAEIVYRLPDHPSVLQTFVWQQLDQAPDFPRLHRFLEFWDRSIEGRLHSVRIAQAALVGEAELRHAGAEFRLH